MELVKEIRTYEYITNYMFFFYIQDHFNGNFLHFYFCKG